MLIILFCIIVVFQILAIITLSILLYETICRSVNHIRKRNRFMLKTGKYVILSSNI
jgi:hypothetical protein